MDNLALFHKGKSHTPVEALAPLAPLADTHGHLAHFTRGDAPDVLCRAALAGVRLLVVPVDPVSDIGPKGRFGSVEGFLAWMDKAVEEAAEPDPAEAFVGVWYLNEMQMEGMSISPASFGVEMTIELKADGIAVGNSVQGEEVENKEGTWALEGDTVTVTIDDEPMVFTVQEGNLVADSDGMVMVFGTEKVEAEIFEPAAARTDAAEEEFAGAWTAFKINMDGSYMDAALLGEEITATIEGTTVTLNGFLFDGDAFETQYADGALAFSVEDPESALIAGIKTELLEDGTMALTITASEDLVLIMNRAE